MVEPLICRDCCIQVCTSLSACVPCQEKRLRHIEKRIYNMEQDLSHTKLDVEANTACRQNQIVLAKSISDLEFRIDTLAKLHGSLSHTCLNNSPQFTTSSLPDRKNTKFIIQEGRSLDGKSAGLKEKNKTLEKLEQTWNDMEEKASKYSFDINKQGTKVVDTRCMPETTQEGYLSGSTYGINSNSQKTKFNNPPRTTSAVQYEHSYKIPQRPLNCEPSYNKCDISDFLHSQQQAFGDLYNLLKTDKDPSLEIPQTSDTHHGNILKQDEQIAAYVEELQKEFQHLTTLLKSSPSGQEARSPNLDQKIAIKLEELEKKFKSLTGILKYNSPMVNSQLEDTRPISRYEQISFSLEELQIEFQQLASLLKLPTPANTSHPQFYDEQIATCIRDVQKRFQRLARLLQLDSSNNQVTCIEDQDEKIINYLQEIEKEFKQLNGLLKPNSPA